MVYSCLSCHTLTKKQQLASTIMHALLDHDHGDIHVGHLVYALVKYNNVEVRACVHIGHDDEERYIWIIPLHRCLCNTTL